MKNTYLKNIILVSSIVTFLLVGSLALDVSAQTGSTALENRFLHTGGNSGTGQPGLLDIVEFELAPKTLQSTGLNLGLTQILNPLEIGNAIIFRIYGTSIFDDVIAYRNAGIKTLFAGFTTAQPFSSGDPVLQVNGSIQVEELSHSDPSGYMEVCVDDFGTMIICTVSVGTNGVCGTANGGTYSSPPAGPALCSVGSASAVNDAGGFSNPRYTWTCAGSGGGSDANCSANYAP